MIDSCIINRSITRKRGQRKFMIDLIIIVLLSSSFLLFILSYFKKDRVSELEQQLEDLSIRHMQEMYQLKKQLKKLEGEVRLKEQQSAFVQQAKSSSQQQLLREVISLYSQNWDFESIAEHTGLTVIEVERLLRPYINDQGKKGEL